MDDQRELPPHREGGQGSSHYKQRIPNHRHENEVVPGRVPAT